MTVLYEDLYYPCCRSCYAEYEFVCGLLDRNLPYTPCVLCALNRCLIEL